MEFGVQDKQHKVSRVDTQREVHKPNFSSYRSKGHGMPPVGVRILML